MFNQIKKLRRNLNEKFYNRLARAGGQKIFIGIFIIFALLTIPALLSTIDMKNGIAEKTVTVTLFVLPMLLFIALFFPAMERLMKLIEKGDGKKNYKKQPFG